MMSKNMFFYEDLGTFRIGRTSILTMSRQDIIYFPDTKRES